MSDISSRSARAVWTSSFPRTERSMYGKSPVEFPRRIVCLTAETTEIAFMVGAGDRVVGVPGDRKSTRLNSSHLVISYAVFCLKKKKTYAIAIGDVFLHVR